MPLYDADWTGTPAEQRRHAFEWGLASLLMGSLLGLMAFAMLISNILIYIQAGRMLSPAEVDLANWVAIPGVLTALILCGLSILFGVRAIRRARADDMPLAVPVAGLLMSVFAFFVWFVVGADLIMILQSLAAGIRPF